MQTMQARFIMDHVGATFASDPAWEQAFEKKVREATGAAVSMKEAAAQLQRTAGKNALNDLVMLNQSKQNVPATTVCDAIGRCKKVAASATSYFMDPRGNVKAGLPGGGPPDASGTWSPTFTQ